MKKLDISIGNLEVTATDDAGWTAVIKYDGEVQNNIERMVIILDGSTPEVKVYTKVALRDEK